MHARFLLGPAGSGKTFRCVAEARSELLRSPEGPPLIFLAPKQATFQIERQLLGPDTPGTAPLSPVLRGYSRLHILSFERLAAFVFEQLGRPLPEMLSEEGRVMVLRALLARHHAELRVFRASARLAGFAAQLSSVLRELQRSRVSATTLTALAGKLPVTGQLADKLHDLALLLVRYAEWLGGRRAEGKPLDDANRLLDLAVEVLTEARLKPGLQAGLRVSALWLDGFAEMTPQETALVAALVPYCERATLAFCLEGRPQGEISWLSPWTVVGRTFAQCRESVAQSVGAEPEIEVLPRDLSRSRFGAAPELLHLEHVWAAGAARGSLAGCESGVPAAAGLSNNPHCPPDRLKPGDQTGGGLADSGPESRPRLEVATPRIPAVRLVACPSPSAEATFAAREILRQVQSGGRFRDCAILVRSLDGYHDVLRRVLSRYEIPFFLDRREAVAHHPLAELSRYALRTVAFDWRPEDWFGVLKTGLAGLPDAGVDWLENEALKRGWAGEVWRRPLAVADDPALSARLEAVRQCVIPAFERFAATLGSPDLRPSGNQLAEALRRLWRDFRVEAQLEAWMESADRLRVSGAAHATVWSQLNDWLDNLSLAFGGEALSLREWLPIIEAGLSGITVGVIPPSLDQVLVGSVDRSRNPDLQTVFVLGVNEGVFPAPPVPGLLLSDSDRLELQAQGIALGATQRQQLGHERYFGYIAFTRPRRQLVVTWTTADEDGAELNASSFVSAIRRAVPDAADETCFEPDWTQALHRAELPRHILAASAVGRPMIGLAGLPEFAPLIRRWEQARDAAAASRLDPEVAGRLYGRELDSSVSAFEDFAACPFRFVTARALRAQEREEFVVDARQKGSFQHEVLQKFHEHVQAANRRWRDLSPAEARQLVREIGQAVAQRFEGGLMVGSEARRFGTAVLIGNLERLMETLVSWAPHYSFDPARVEASFGLEGASLPAWTILLTQSRTLRLRGRIDRVDVCRDAAGGAWVVICDYKSGGKEMDSLKVAAGLELQLLSYLAALTQMPEAGAWLEASRLQPAGVFYVPLRSRAGSAANRKLAAETDAEPGLAFQHRGRFDGALLRMFDNRGVTKGEQFRFKLNKGGELAKVGNDALPPGTFSELVRGAESKLRTLAERILQGEAGVEPYRLKQQTACDLCAYRAVCRFDPWTMPFRTLKEDCK